MSVPELDVLQGCATIQLSRGMNALVDATDLEWLGGRKWCATICNGRFYGKATGRTPGKRDRPYLHRYIMEMTGSSVQVDHRNRDTLDNRRTNLRPATVGQNRSNSRKKFWRGGKSSEFKGVSWHKRTSRWRAVIVKDKRQRELGLFDSEADAARAYNRAAMEMHGEFARINEGI